MGTTERFLKWIKLLDYISLVSLWSLWRKNLRGNKALDKEAVKERNHSNPSESNNILAFGTGTTGMDF